MTNLRAEAGSSVHGSFSRSVAICLGRGRGKIKTRGHGKKFRCPLLCINLLAAASIFPLIAALCNRLSVGHDKLCFESRAEGLMSEFQVARSKSAEYNCSVSIAEPCRANQV